MIDVREVGIHLSNSRLEDILHRVRHDDGTITWEPGCAFVHQQTEYGGIIEPDTPESALGVLLHAAAKGYGELLVRYKRWSDREGYRRIVHRLLEQAGIPEHEWWEAEKLGDTYLEGFSFKEGDLHLFEPRLACDRVTLTPCDPLAPVDRIAGSMDYVRLHGKKCELLDLKFGFKKFWTYSAQDDLQLQLYAWLLSKHYPQLEVIDAELWCPRYGAKNRATATFPVETLDGLVLPRLEAGFALIDREIAENGALGPWTARAHWSVCKWCRLTSLCPLVLAAREKYNGQPIPPANLRQKAAPTTE